MNTCPVCNTTDSSIALIHLYNLTFSICDHCGGIKIQETGHIIQMSRFHFGNGFMAVAWAAGEINNAIVSINTERMNNVI